MQDLSVPQALLMENFTELMKRELVANGDKGDITSWNPSVYDLIAETGYHMAKLTKAMFEVECGGVEASRKQVDEFAADVANYMVKTAQQFGTLSINR